MNVKANQHYQRTHQAIQDIFLRLLEEKDLKYISVSEICRSLGISRGTFYEHFTDVYDLLEKMNATITEGLQRRYLKALETSIREAILEIFRYVLENRTFYSIILDQQKIPISEEKLYVKDLDSFNLPEKDPRERLTEADNYYLDALYRSEIRTLLRCWLDRDCRESPEYLLDILLQKYHYSQLTPAE